MLDKLYKLMFDLCICYTIGAFLLRYVAGRTGDGKAFLFLMLGVVGSALLSRYRRGGILATVLIPALYPALWMPSVPELVIFLLVLGYLVFEVVTQHFIIGRDGFAERLKRLLYLSPLIVFPMIISFQEFSQAFGAAAPYLIGALISAVFLLRHLRAVDQVEHRREYQWQQMTELSVFLAVCLILTLVRAPQNLMFGLKQIYHYILGPLLSFLASAIIMLVYWIIRLIVAAVGMLTGNPELIERGQELVNPPGDLFRITGSDVSDTGWWAPLLYSVGFILGLMLLFLFFRWLLGERMNRSIPPGVMEIREYLSTKKDGPSGLRRKAPQNPQAAVRYYYEKYLRLLKRKKIELNSQDTTKEILEKHIALQGDENTPKQASAAELRDIYREARYRMEKETTPEEAKKARKRYREIKRLLP